VKSAEVLALPDRLRMDRPLPVPRGQSRVTVPRALALRILLCGLGGVLFALPLSLWRHRRAAAHHQRRRQGPALRAAAARRAHHPHPVRGTGLCGHRVAGRDPPPARGDHRDPGAGAGSRAAGRGRGLAADAPGPGRRARDPRRLPGVHGRRRQAAGSLFGLGEVHRTLRPAGRLASRCPGRRGPAPTKQAPRSSSPLHGRAGRGLQRGQGRRLAARPTPIRGATSPTEPWGARWGRREFPRR
jgi:hypothetical protein